MPLVHLPIVTVQHDFETVLADVKDGTVEQDKFWISCYKEGEQSVHASVQVTQSRPGQTLSLLPNEGLVLSKQPVSAFFASAAEDLHAPTPIGNLLRCNLSCSLDPFPTLSCPSLGDPRREKPG